MNFSARQAATIAAPATRPENAIQLYAFGDPDGKTVKIGYSKHASARKLQHERRGWETREMAFIAVWWGTKADEGYIKEYFKHLAKKGTTEWFECDDLMRQWLRNMRKHYFVAHDAEEIDEMPFVDSVAWLPARHGSVGLGFGQLGLALPTPSGDGAWSDVTVATDKIGDGDFYSPPELTAAARAVMGEIDLDPASCRRANRRVLAKRYFSWAEDGLIQAWAGRLWINPPFPWEPWVEKFLSEWRGGRVTQAIILCETRVTTAKYFHPMVAQAAALLKMKGRLQFWGPKAGSPDEGHELYYFGTEVEAFAREFSRFGSVFVPCQSGRHGQA